MNKKQSIGGFQKILNSIRKFFSLRWIRDTWMYIVRIVERMEDNHIFLSAAGLSFNAIICFIPITLLVFYFLGLYLDPETAIETVNHYLEELDLFPFQREQYSSIIIQLLHDFVSGSQLAGVLGGIGLLWTATTLFAAARTVLNRIYNVKDMKNFIVSKLKDFSMIFLIGVLLLIITLILQSGIIMSAIGRDVLGLDLHGWLFQSFAGFMTPLLISFLLLILIFIFIPDTRLPMKVVLISSLVAAVFWGVARVVFAYYIEHLWRIGSIYGPYAIAVATGIWVYYSFLTTLVAAEIGEMYRERSQLKKLFEEESLQEMQRLAIPPRVFPPELT